jgi:hypothetical protein
MSSFAAPQQGAYGPGGSYEAVAAQIAARDPTAYGYLANAQAQQVAGQQGYRQDLLRTIAAQREASLMEAADKRTGRQIDAFREVRQGLDPNIVTQSTNLMAGVSPGVVNSTAQNNIADRIAARYKDVLPGMASSREAGIQMSPEAVAGATNGRYLQPGDITMTDPASVRAAGIRAASDDKTKIVYTPGMNGAPPVIQVTGIDPDAVTALGQRMNGNVGDAGSPGVLPRGSRPVQMTAELQTRINAAVRQDPQATSRAVMHSDGKVYLQLKDGGWKPLL